MGKLQCKYLCNVEKPCRLTLTKCLSLRASLTFKGNDAVWNPNLCALCSSFYHQLLFSDDFLRSANEDHYSFHLHSHSPSHWVRWGEAKGYRMSSVISLIVQCPIPVSSSEWPKAAENKNALQKCIKISISHKRLLVQPWWSQTWRGTGDIAPGQIYAYTGGIPGYPLWNKESKCLYFKEEETELQREAICPRSHDKLMRKLGLPNME